MKRKQVYYNQDTSKLQEQKAYGEFQDIPANNAAPYKVYTALLTQTGTNPPVVTILQNTIGNIVWTRWDVGLYGATLAGAFTIGKTFLYIGLNVLPNMFNVIDYDTFGNPDTIDIWVYDTIGQGMHDGNLLGTPIEIRIYP
jgi:hypothetical protein